MLLNTSLAYSSSLSPNHADRCRFFYPLYLLMYYVLLCPQKFGHAHPSAWNCLSFISVTHFYPFLHARTGFLFLYRSKLEFSSTLRLFFTNILCGFYILSSLKILQPLGIVHRNIYSSNKSYLISRSAVLNTKFLLVTFFFLFCCWLLLKAYL